MTRLEEVIRRQFTDCPQREVKENLSLGDSTPPPVGANFKGFAAGDGDSKFLLTSDSGYGFVATLVDLKSKNKNGKAIMKVVALIL